MKPIAALPWPFAMATSSAMAHATRIIMLIAGWLLILLSPVVGALPGPGGLIVLALGLGLVLRSSRWAKRRYVAFKRRWPKQGAWADWGLRRASARRRRAGRAHREPIGGPD